MDERLDMEELTAPLRNDVQSGAAEMARTAADVMRSVAESVDIRTLEGLRDGLTRTGLAVLSAQPAMAPLVALVTAVLEAVEAAPDVARGREAAAGAADDFARGQGDRAARVAARGRELLPTEGSVLTLSWSSTVRDTLLENPRRGDLGVVVLESRPLLEGRRLAEVLAREGIPVTVAVDAAADALVRRSEMVLLGADSVGDQGVVNKLGSLAVARAARSAGVPTVVLADSTKILPRGFPQDPWRTGSSRPADDVWQAPAGVAVWNHYFEVVPMELLTSVVTERGILTPSKLARFRRGLRLPAAVRAWAAALP